MKKLKIPRSLVLLIVFFIMFSILIVRLFQLQIVKGQEYENNFILQTKREIVLSGARGNIYDRNGKPLATNKLANSVTFEDQETYNSDRERQLNLNSKIYQMIRIIKSKGDSIETSLKIIIDPNGNFQFSVDDFWLQRFKADVYGKANIDDMEAKERNSTADEIVSYLSDKFCVFAQGEKKYTDKEKKDYGLPQQFEKSDLLDILNIRYALSLQAYQKYLSVTVVKDVSDETVAAIMENQYDISGVDIKQDTIRVYEGGEACSSILGYTGTISSEELKERDDSKLTINSIVGKSGMEQYLDQVLQGRDGKKEVYVDNTGRTTQDLGVIQQPRAGKDVYLSIDVELQKKTYEALERKIADILFQIHYEWNKELFCLYYQTQNRKYRRILLFFCGAVIIFSFCLCSKIGREMIMTMMILFVCAVILINNIYLRLATYIQMETALKQYGTGKRIMTIKKDEINVLVPESGKKIIVSFIEIMEIGTIKEYCWIRVINQLIFIRKENFVIGDIEDFKRFIKLNTLAGEDWSRVWKGRN